MRCYKSINDAFNLAVEIKFQLNFSNKIINQSSFINNVGKLLTANVLVQIVAFVLSTIITRLYSDDDFGVLAKFMSVAGIFIVLATARLEYAIILPKDDEEAKSIFSLSFLISIIVSLFSFLFLLIFRNKIESYFNIENVSSWIILMPLVVFFSGFINIAVNYKNREKKYNQMAIGQSVAGVLNPIFSISFFKILYNGLIEAVFVSNFFASIYLGITLLKENIFKTTVKFSVVLKKYYRFPSFNLVHALLNIISSSLPVFMLSPVFENHLIGLFTMAMGKVFKPVNLFGSAIYQVFSKKIVDDLHLKKDVSLQVRKVLLVLFGLGIVPFLILYMYAPSIFSFIWGEDWMQAGVYLKLLLPWLFMVYLTSSLSFIPNLLEKQKTALFIEFIYLVLRFFALSYGIKNGSLEMALSAFSWVGVFVLSFTLAWYYYLVKNVGNQNE